MANEFDAIVVGSGPNGLAAAIVLARSGRRVLVREAQPTLGGGLRSAAFTLPGFMHDVCSAVHPLAVSSPFLKSLPLEAHGVEWMHPAAPLAHPLDDGSAVLLERSLDATAAGLDDADGADGERWTRMMRPFVERWTDLTDDILGPPHLPAHPILLARFGMHAIRSASGLATAQFRGERARALFAGNAAHSFLPLDRSPSAAFGLVLAIAGHAAGWPVARGGSQAVADAMLAYFKSLGGEIVADAPVHDIDEVRSAPIVLLDLMPREVLRIAGHRLPAGYRRALERYRSGPGAFKIDWALDGPIPWTAPECARAATVHLGGTLEEIAASEAAPEQGRISERPFVLLAQSTLADPSRAPAGRHTVWAYCHVPYGSTVDMTDRIERQIERFAPGFRERVLARHVTPPGAMEHHNGNLAGGDISGGAADLRQLLFRPVPRLNPYTTPLDNVFFCSAATPPGAGVHGMCGYHAARTALRRRG